MSDYIKRDDIIKALGELCDTPAGQSTGLTALVYAAKTIEGLPAADVVERKKGEWIEKPYVTMEGYVDGLIYNCSKCGKKATRYTISNYCPNCGADMRKGGHT